MVRGGGGHGGEDGGCNWQVGGSDRQLGLSGTFNCVKFLSKM